MAVRNWNDDASELRVPVVAASELTGDYTVAALVKPNVKAGEQTIIAGNDAAGDEQWVFGINASNVPFFLAVDAAATSAATGGVALTDGEWSLVAYTRSSSTGPRRFHVLELGGAWDHVAGDLGGTVNPPLTTAGGSVSFGFSPGGVSNDLSARMAVAGLWKSAMSDAQVEALAAGLGSADWTEHAVAAGGVWNFNQADEADPVPELTGHHAAISGTLSGPTDNNGISGTTIEFADDPPGWDFTTTPPPLRITFRYSGGAANADQSASIGGAESSAGGEEADGLTGVLFNVLPDFDRPDAIAGTTVYRGFYVHLENNGFAAPADLAIWLQDTALVTGVAVAIGAAPEGPGGTMQTLADETTAPDDVSFSIPASEVGAIPLGEASAEDGVGVWARVTLGTHLAGGLSNTCPFAVEVTPL